MLNKKALSAAPSVETDDDFKQTVLLLHGDGTNGAQNNTFTDSSTNNFTITRNGNTTQGTFSPFSVGAGAWSNYFDGTEDYLTSSTALFNYTTGNAASETFTIEAWVYITTFQSAPTNIWENPCIAGKGNVYMNFGVNATGNLFFYHYDGTSRSVTSSGTISANTWTHVAVVVSGGTATLYINAVSNGSGTWYGIEAGGQNSTSYFGETPDTDAKAWFGYISNVRVSNNARSISVPTAPYTSDGNTNFLSCQSNRFVDNSTNAYTITRNGDVSVQPFSPFAPSAAYSASTNGGSGYFDGTGDYLTAPDNAALDLSGDFTVECWVYVPNVSGEKCVFHNHTSDGNGIAFIVNGAAVRLLSGTGGDWSVILDSSTSITAKSWNHIAGTRSGNTYTVWVNGASGGTATSSTTPSYSGGAQIGRFTSGSPNAFLDYMSSLRVVKGTAVYTGTFTPPTAPLTAITNTSLLLNFTNAGIIDNTGKNNLETVGNAQIDTGTKKFGTGSLKFDGTGDGLSIRSNDNLAFGTGNWTVEFWVYHTSISGQQTYISDTFGNTNGPYIYKDGYDKIGLYYSSQILTATNAISATTWYHVAICRGSGTVRLFINGVEEASTSDSTNLSVPIQWIGADTDSAYFNGYLDDIRITKGVARYTAAFTPPAKAFADQ